MRAQVTLRIPADSRFVATTRVTAASVAAELEFSVDEIEELRVGVNELAAVLIEWAEDHGCTEIELTCVGSDSELEISGIVIGADARADGSTPDPAPDDLGILTEQILAGTMDDHRLGGPSGRIIKRRASA